MIKLFLKEENNGLKKNEELSKKILGGGIKEEDKEIF